MSDLIDRQAAIDALEGKDMNVPSNDLISRQAAIDVLEKIFPADPMRNEYTQGITCGAALATEYIKQLPSAQPQWIPVTEKLPNEYKKCYWVQTDTGHMCECRWTNINHFWTDLTTAWHWNFVDIPPFSKVVAWRPLPEPYKEDENV